MTTNEEPRPEAVEAVSATESGGADIHGTPASSAPTLPAAGEVII